MTVRSHFGPCPVADGVPDPCPVCGARVEGPDACGAVDVGPVLAAQLAEALADLARVRGQRDTLREFIRWADPLNIHSENGLRSIRPENRERLREALMDGEDR